MNDKLKPLHSMPYFSISALASLLQTNSQVAKTMASRWASRGRILRLKRGVYMTREFLLINHSKPGFTNLVANILQPDSYLSLEYVLQDEGILTEATFPVTAVTIKNTAVFENKLGIFSYRHLQNKLFQGYTKQLFAGIECYRASRAKALFDYFYFRPLKNPEILQTINLAEELRLNMSVFSQKDKVEFEKYVGLACSLKMVTIINNLKRYR